MHELRTHELKSRKTMMMKKKQKQKIKRTAVIAAVVAVVVVVAGALWASRSHSDSPDTPDQASPAASKNYLFDQLRPAYAAAAAEDKPKTLTQLLPSQLYAIDGGDPAPLLQGLLLGTITKVVPGRGFKGEDAAKDLKTLGFDDPAATWRTLVITTKVTIGWGGAVAGRDQVSFMLRIPGGVDPARAMAGVRAMHQVVVGLNGRGVVRAEPDLALVALKGSLFGPVAANGDLQLPVMADAGRFLGKITTAELLRTIASKPRPTITLKHRGGQLVQAKK